MNKSTITRDELNEVIATYGKHHIAHRMANVLLAAMDSEPVADDYFASLVTQARARADKAMRKFPQPNYVLNKVAEESGEVIKAVIHYTEGREEWRNVEGEIIDNLAMLIRLVQEGDQVIGFTPPTDCRAAILAAAPQSPGSDPATVPGKWISVSERMPEYGDYLVTDGRDFDVQLFDGEQFIPGFVWEDKITHWMPLPAAPQEVSHG